MRENRTYGSEGGATGVTTGRSYPYQGRRIRAPGSRELLDERPDDFFICRRRLQA
jgi:hypothetical protein